MKNTTSGPTLAFALAALLTACTAQKQTVKVKGVSNVSEPQGESSREVVELCHEFLLDQIGSAPAIPGTSQSTYDPVTTIYTDISSGALPIPEEIPPRIPST